MCCLVLLRLLAATVRRRVSYAPSFYRPSTSAITAAAAFVAVAVAVVAIVAVALGRRVDR
jgi:hypothetical protein